MTFKLISAILRDSTRYTNNEEWKRRLETLTCSQLQLISLLCEGDKDVPIFQWPKSNGVLPTNRGLEVWVKPGRLPMVTMKSRDSLLPALDRLEIAKPMVERICLAIEFHMQRVPFTLGLGEENRAWKPVIEYDRICKPRYLYSLIKQSSPFHNIEEDHTIYTVHQISEAWLFVANVLLKRIRRRIEREDSVGASRDCRTVEKIWKLLTEIQSLFLLLDPDDFLSLMNNAKRDGISATNGAYCLNSAALRSLTGACKELRNLVPKVVDVEADPNGGTRVQESVMRLFHSNRRDQGSHRHGKLHLLLAFQAIEASVKTFFFSYQQLVIVVMGRAELMNGFAGYTGASDALSHIYPDSQIEMIATSSVGPSDPLTEIYSEPPYFPSVDAAKTLLSDYWLNNPTNLF